MIFRLCLILTISSAALFAPELRWDWSKINTSTALFPKNFLWGVADAEYQVSGAGHCPHSNWAEWERKGKVPKSGTACDSYNRMDEDVECAKKLGVKAFRFSVAWDKIEPEEGMFDEAAIQHYQTFCDKIVAAGMQPVVTLHHFVHPQWFEEKGAFEKEDNIKHFVNFGVKMFDALKDHGVKIWCTINEPGVLVFQGYFRGVYPPGRTIGANVVGDFKRAGQVAYNLIQAHTHTYNAIKSCNGGDQAQVGMTHSVTLFEPYHDSHPGEKMLTQMINHWFHDAITKYLKTGVFKWYIPMPCSSMSIDDAGSSRQPKLDFIGLQYYSHVLLSFPYIWPREYLSFILPNSLISKEHTNFTFGQAYRPDEVRTDMPYAIYPEGMYRAIKSMSELKKEDGSQVPIIITEMGIGDAKDDRRAQFTKKYLYAVSRAVEEGADVRGCFYWSLMDNLEWDMGYTQKFGLYEVDMETKERKLRQGALAYIESIKRHNEEHKLQ